MIIKEHVWCVACAQQFVLTQPNLWRFPILGQLAWPVNLPSTQRKQHTFTSNVHPICCKTDLECDLCSMQCFNSKKSNCSKSRTQIAYLACGLCPIYWLKLHKTESLQVPSAGVSGQTNEGHLTAGGEQFLHPLMVTIERYIFLKQTRHAWINKAGISEHWKILVLSHLQQTISFWKQNWMNLFRTEKHPIGSFCGI